MAEYRWSEPSTINTILSTELDSLVDDGNVLSSAIDNTSNRKDFIDLELSLASVDLSSQTNPAVYLWFLKSIDGGTTYEDGGASVSPARSPDVIIPLREVSGAQVVNIDNIIFPPYHVKILWGNRTGAAHSTGNTLRYRLHSMEDN